MTLTSKPGLVYDLPNADYHADPALSCSGAKKLISSTPAAFKWERDNGRPNKKAFDIGSAAHTLVLGTCEELVKIDADRWDTKAVKEQVAEVRARGGIPLKPDEYTMVHSMAMAIARHPLASRLFDAESGDPEVSAFYSDAETGIDLRARIDWLPHRTRSGRLLIADYKTTLCADAEVFARKDIWDFRYYMQAPWYLDALAAIDYCDEAAWLFVAQEKSPPYLVNVIEIDSDAIRYGRARNREAINLYASCLAADDWPGYGDEVALVSLPPWVRR